MKSFISPGGDGIISELYQLYWEVFEKDFRWACKWSVSQFWTEQFSI
jgi:hypothetical protein